jgi:Glycosyltransferase family 25 (LPS biosynthesis protein)
MKVFVINLDRRQDRLAEISAELSRLGLEFERISAVDAKHVSVKNLVEWWKARVYNNFENPPVGQIGVFHSHRIAWQKMVDQNIPQALIFEDDALAINWDERITKLNLSELGLDQLRLERLTLRVWHPFPLDKKIYNVLGQRAVNEASFGAAAQLLTLEGARKCLSVDKMWFNIDHYDFWSGVAGLRTAVLEKPMFQQSVSESDIAPQSAKRSLISVVLFTLKSFCIHIRRNVVFPICWLFRFYLNRPVAHKHRR